MATREIKKRPSADATRDKIIKEARKLFAKKGFAATSISEIAGKAKINQSLIYHHFGSKEGLWTHIKTEIFEKFAEQQGIEIADYDKEKDAKSFITAIYNFRYDMYDKNPELPRMITWQRMEASSSKLIGPRHSTIKQLVEIVERFQKEGQITDKYEAEELIYVIFANAAFWFGDFQTINRKLSAKDKKTKKEQWRTMMLEMTIKELQP